MGTTDDAPGATPFDFLSAANEFMATMRDPQGRQKIIEKFGDTTARQVSLDDVMVDGKRYTVSTVGLVIPHPGGTFETMIFPTGTERTLTRRYVTAEAAAAGHQEMVVGLNAGLFDDYFAS